MPADRDPRSAPGTWRRKPGWVHRTVDEEILLMGPGPTAKTIGGLATPVWLVLDRPASGPEIQDLIARRWPERPVDPAAVTETLEVLHRSGLIEPT